MSTRAARRSTRRGYRVGAVLALIAFVPLAGAGGFAIDEVLDARSDQSLIEGVESDTRELLLLTELRAKLFDERNWASATDGIVDIGLTTEFVAAITGIDIPSALATATTGVDELLSRLDLGDFPDRLDEIRRAEMDLNQRGDSYDGLETELGDRSTELIDRVAGDTAQLQADGALIDDLRLLEHASNARSAVSEEFNAFFSAQFSAHSVQAEEVVGLIGSRARREAAVEALERVARPASNVGRVLETIEASPDAATFDAAVDALAAQAVDGLLGDAGIEGVPIDIVGTAAVFEASSVASDLYLDLVRAAGDDVASLTSDAADRADTRTRRAMTSIAALFLLSAIIALAAARSIARPLRRLAEAAQHLRDGRPADVDPDEGGPTEVRQAARALFEASEQLQLAERQALALAEGDLDHESLSQPATGQLGTSLQSAVDTLTASLHEREALQDRMAHEATHDGLTNLSNRNASLDQIAAGLFQAARTNSRIAVLFVDLDGFKDVNDQFGHHAGDVVLQQIAARLARAVPAGDHVGRLGGDEFLVVAADIADERAAAALARAIFDEVNAPVRVADVEVQIGLSIGVAVSEGSSMNAEELLHDADMAVYRAKELGRNRVEVCDANLRSVMTERADIEQALRTALERDDELELWYQPVVTERSEFAPAGYEALLRWNRPGHGMIHPDRFVPVAERTDLILEVDRWVILHAIEQIAEWDLAGELTGIPISVNISGRHLASPDLVTTIIGALLRNSVDPRRLILEVTESALLDDVATAGAKLEQLREYGIRVAIDDFGTGFTSLAHLRNLPFDILKIDRSFTNDDDATSLVQLIIDSGHLLGASVTAEGVETESQANRMLAMGVDSLQGFYFGRPAPIVDMLPAIAVVAGES